MKALAIPPAVVVACAWLAAARAAAAAPSSDGSATVCFSPEQPHEVARGNWTQTAPARGWSVILRLRGPLEPFFDKTWRPSEIEPLP